MVKFNRRDKKLKDFDKILEEITEYQTCNSDNESISIEDIEYEVLSDSQDNYDIESSENFESSSDGYEELEIKPGQSFNISGGRVLYDENSEDFPKENSEIETQYAFNQLNHLSIVDRKEYNDNKNILKPIKKDKSNQKRCQNYD